ncbi:MAG: O-antigen ligase family protein, partial [Terriglobales bacterium]
QVETLKFAAYALLFFLTVQTMQGEDMRKLAEILIWFGFLLAIFAMIQDLTSNGKLYWLRKPQSGGSFFGPYVNRNHYAGLMEMLVPFAIVLAMAPAVSRTLQALMTFATLTMGGSIFLSRSRGGLMAFAVQLALLTVLYMRDRKSWRLAISVAVLGALSLGFVLYLDRGQMVGRLETLKEIQLDGPEGQRLTIARDGLKMFAERPWTGWGLGTFPVVYPQYRSYFTDKFVNQAHNDYLQALVETGLPGFAVLLWFLVVLFRSAAKGARKWATSSRAAVTLAALTGCVGILVHSFVDFNLRIPANAALFAVLCALASSPHSQPRRTSNAA